jgi:hypothetical protein
MFSDWTGPYKKESKGSLHVNLRVFKVKEAHAAWAAGAAPPPPPPPPNPKANKKNREKTNTKKNS